MHWKVMAVAKVVVIGLDGVSWEVIRPWIQKGELPNLAKMIKEGSSAVLETLMPPLTCPAWKYYSTGKNAGKFGVYCRTELDFANEKIVPVDSGNYGSREIWDYLGEAGMKSGVIDMPTTYPPKKVNGFMIGSIEPPNYGDYTYPKELQKELEEKFSYKPDITGRIDDPTKELEEELFSLIETRFDILDANLKEYDFLHLTVVFTDYVMHFYWNDDFAKKIFRKIDERIGKTLEKAGKGCNVIVMSDHGFTRLKARFFANEWLKKEGYLKTREGMTNALFRIGINKESVLGFLRRLGLEGIAKKVVPKEMGEKIKSKHGFVGGESAGGLLDWKKSKVICNGNDLFYINPNVKGEEREKIIKDVKQKLLQVRLPGGEKVIERVLLKEEAYSGKFLGKAPDLVTVSKEWCETCSPLGSGELFELESRWLAIHAKNGIVIAKGPGIKKGLDFGKASILDLAPTILHLLKVPIPEDFDGKVLEKILESERA